MIELLQYTFFQNSLVACVLTGIVCGLCGTYIVARRMVFMAGGMAHTALGGVGICALCGLPPLMGAAAATLLTGWGIQGLSARREVRQDSAIAMLWALGMSVGIMCSYLSPTFLPNLSSYLFGNVLLLNSFDLWALGALTLVAVAVFAGCLPQIASVSFDPEFARAQKQPVRFINRLMISLVALCIVCTLKVSGVVLVISLLSVPQMTANLFCRRFGEMAVWSAVIAVAGCLAGLMMSVWLNVPCGAMVVAAVIMVYAMCRAIKHLFFSYKV